jgi:hypothetical protein
MPPQPVAARPAASAFSLVFLTTFSEAGEIERVNARFARVEQVKQFRSLEIGGRACAGTTSIRL